MQLSGSCHCGAVRFSVESPHPYPFNLCYCSICRKTAGGGGYAINLGAQQASLQVEGVECLSVYRARLTDAATGATTESPGERNFCSRCGSALWLWDPRWPELVHPFASAIDSELPVPPERTHLMLGSRASWVPVHAGPEDRLCEEYPQESIEDWHRRLGLEDTGH
jgi:hypothetical protein